MSRVHIDIPEYASTTISYDYVQSATINPAVASMRMSARPGRLRWWLARKILKLASRIGAAPAVMLGVYFKDDAEANKRNWIAVAHTLRRVGPLFLEGLNAELLDVQVERVIAEKGAKEPAA